MGGFDRFLMTPWNVCQNPSYYKNAQGSRRRQIKQGEMFPLLLHALVMPRVVKGPENAVSQVERLHSHAAPGIGGRFCVVVGDEDGNWSFFAFLKNKQLPYVRV